MSSSKGSKNRINEKKKIKSLNKDFKDCIKRIKLIII